MVHFQSRLFDCEIWGGGIRISFIGLYTTDIDIHLKILDFISFERISASTTVMSVSTTFEQTVDSFKTQLENSSYLKNCALLELICNENRLNIYLYTHFIWQWQILLDYIWKICINCPLSHIFLQVSAICKSNSPIVILTNSPAVSGTRQLTDKTIHRHVFEDSSPTDLKTVLRHYWRQFIDTFLSHYWHMAWK